MRCKYCGDNVSKGIPYCPSCGGYLPENLANGRNSESRKQRWIIAIILMLAVIACVSLYFASTAKYEDIPAELERVDNLVDDAIKDLLADDGTLSKENVPRAIEAVYEAGKRNSDAYAYVEKNDDNVVFGFKRGGAYVYLPPTPNGNVPAQPQALTPAVIPPGMVVLGGRITTIAPFQAETKRLLPSHYRYTDAAAEAITDALPAYTFLDNGTFDDDNREDGEVTLAFLKTLSSYSVVIWMGHGGYSSTFGSFLLTGNPYDPAYDKDFRAGRLMWCSNECYGVTDAFFSHYLQPNPGQDTVAYLASCRSADDSRLANSLLAKGFDCVIANQNEILTTYNILMEYTFYAGMAGVGGSFLTAGDALQRARDLYGETDPIYGGKPQLFGDPNVRFYRSAPAETPLPKTSSPSPTETAAPTEASAPAATPTATPKVDIGKSDADFMEKPYLAEVRELLQCTEAAWTPPVEKALPMCAGVIKDVSEQNGVRTITVDYASWDWTDSTGAHTLLYANRSKTAYTLPLSSDCLISIPWPDRTDDMGIYEKIDSDAARASAYYEKSSWATLCQCYDQITDPGETWSQPTYFFIAFNNANEVICIWEDVYFYTNN